MCSSRSATAPGRCTNALGSGVLEIYPLPAEQAVDTTTRLGFAVDDPDQVASDVDVLGGRLIASGRETLWGYIAIVADPDGRTVELHRA